MSRGDAWGEQEANILSYRCTPYLCPSLCPPSPSLRSSIAVPPTIHLVSCFTLALPEFLQLSAFCRHVLRPARAGRGRRPLVSFHGCEGHLNYRPTPETHWRGCLRYAGVHTHERIHTQEEGGRETQGLFSVVSGRELRNKTKQRNAKHTRKTKKNDKNEARQTKQTKQKTHHQNKPKHNKTKHIKKQQPQKTSKKQNKRQRKSKSSGSG